MKLCYNCDVGCASSVLFACFVIPVTLELHCICIVIDSGHIRFAYYFFKFIIFMLH